MSGTDNGVNHAPAECSPHADPQHPPSTNTPEPQQSESQQAPLVAIDVSEAMAILSQRQKQSHQHQPHDQSHDHDETTEHGGCSCTSNNQKNKLSSPADHAKGQTIYLYGEEEDDSKTPNSDNTSTTTEKDAVEKQREELKIASQKRQEELRVKLQDMKLAELIKTVLDAQAERTLVYKEFDGSLQTVLETSNISNYPAACAKATASFSVLSDLINSVRDALRKQQKTYKEAASMVQQLQHHEQQKLQSTAAWHLERMRLNQLTPAPDLQMRSCGAPSYKNDNDGKQEEEEESIEEVARTRALLQQNVRTLEQKVRGCEEEINDVLEELRYAHAEAFEEEEES